MPPDLAGLMETAVTALRQGRLDKARSYVQKVLEVNNRQSKVWYLLSSIESQAGDLRASKQAIQAALKLHPNNVKYLITQARILRAQDDLVSAVDCLKRVLDQDVKSLDAHVLLGRCYKAQGEIALALDALQSAVRLNESPELLNELGALWEISGNHQAALACIQKAVDLRADYPAAYNNLGNIYLNTGQVEAAVKAFKTAIGQRYEYPLAHNNLGLALRSQGSHMAALKAFDQALILQPTNVEVLCNRGALLQSLGYLERAETDYETALDQQPDFTRGVSGIAELHEWRGEYDNGLKMLSHVDETVNSPELVTVKARLLRRVGDLDAGIRLLSPVFKQKDLPLQTHVQVAFTLGDLYDSAGKYEAAFHCYQTANQRDVRSFDSEVHHEWVIKLIETFAAEAFQATSRREPSPVFIVGMPRSGTSLVEQILAAHPKVYAEGERPTMGQIVMELRQEDVYPQGVFALSRHRLDGLAEQYWSQHRAPIVTDKMPLNFLHLGMINLLFPAARVIHCKRNPVDTALSCYFTNFVDPNLGFSSDLEKMARYYEDYEALMVHWDHVLGLETYELAYESLVRDANGVVHSLLQFLDLPWHDDCMEFHRLDRVTSTASHAQVRKPIYTSSVGRYKNYEKYLGPLKRLQA